MPSPSESPFGDVLLCPVCMEIFEGRILQCSQGHAVCEKCQLQLTECPHCRGVYVGTRNYILEQVIEKLKRFTTSNGLTLGDEYVDTKSVLSDEHSTVSVPLGIGETTVNTDVVRSIPPVQGSGQYDCRMLECNAKLPICRLLNHLRYFHKNFLVETQKSTTPYENTDFVGHWTIPCSSFRKAFHLYNFGIYFLIVNVKKTSNDTNIKAWVQGACPNGDARHFRFSLELLLGDAVATFTDYVVGAQSDTDYIESNNNCLNVNTSNINRDVIIEMKISRNHGTRSLPRSNQTNYRVLPPNSQQQQQQHQRQQNQQQQHQEQQNQEQQHINSVSASLLPRVSRRRRQNNRR